MKTMRRAFATAAIGVMAAGVIGLAAPAASAAPASASNDSVGIQSVNCDYYKDMAIHYGKIADNSGGHKSKQARQMSASYWAKYYACIY